MKEHAELNATHDWRYLQFVGETVCDTCGAIQGTPQAYRLCESVESEIAMPDHESDIADLIADHLFLESF